MTTSKTRILLIEDNPGDIRLTREALKETRMPIELQIAENGYEAMDLLQAGQQGAQASLPDLILLDLNLPGKNGREVLQDIKLDESLRCIPIVVLTSSSDERDITESYRLYANCYITKPIDVSTFKTVVRQIEQFWFSIASLPSA